MTSLFSIFLFLFLLTSYSSSIRQKSVLHYSSILQGISRDDSVQKQLALKTYYSLKPPEKSKTPTLQTKSPNKRQFKRKDPPLNAKLNMRLILFQEASFKKTFENLLDKLYLNAYLEKSYRRYRNTILQEIYQACFRKNLKSPHDLATIDFQNSSIQRLWYQMLKGVPEKSPSLLDFVTVIPQKQLSNTGKINIHYASFEIIFALTGSEKLSYCLINDRSSFIQTQQVEKIKITELMEKWLSSEVTSEIIPLIDFTKGVSPHHE